MAARKKPVRVGMLSTVRVDRNGKVIPTPEAFETIRRKYGAPKSLNDAVHHYRLAVAQTLISAWSGDPARYDDPGEGGPD